MYRKFHQVLLGRKQTVRPVEKSPSKPHVGVLGTKYIYGSIARRYALDDSHTPLYTRCRATSFELMLPKSASVNKSVYRCGRKTRTMPESEPHRVNTIESPYFVEMRFALVMRYCLWGSKKDTLT